MSPELSTLRVFHCDDSPAFTVLVAHWLAEHPDLVPVGVAHDRESALSGLPGARAHCVLLDTMGFGPDALSVQDVRAVAPGCRVVVYSGYPRDSAERLGAAGADLYVRKDSNEQALVAALRALRHEPPAER